VVSLVISLSFDLALPLMGRNECGRFSCDACENLIPKRPKPRRRSFPAVAALLPVWTDLAASAELFCFHETCYKRPRDDPASFSPPPSDLLVDLLYSPHPLHFMCDTRQALSQAVHLHERAEASWRNSGGRSKGGLQGQLSREIARKLIKVWKFWKDPNRTAFKLMILLFAGNLYTRFVPLALFCVCHFILFRCGSCLFRTCYPPLSPRALPQGLRLQPRRRCRLHK
jgi:hypothetical protein